MYNTSVLNISLQVLNVMVGCFCERAVRSGYSTSAREHGAASSLPRAQPQHTQQENRPGLAIWESGPTNSPVMPGSQDSGSGSKTWLRQGPRAKA